MIQLQESNIMNPDLSPLSYKPFSSSQQYLCSPMPNDSQNNLDMIQVVKKLDFDESPFNNDHIVFLSPNILLNSTVKKNQIFPRTPIRFQELFNQFNTESRDEDQRLYDTDNDDFDERLKCYENNFDYSEQSRNVIQPFEEHVMPYDQQEIKRMICMQKPDKINSDGLPGLRRNQMTLQFSPKFQNSSNDNYRQQYFQNQDQQKKIKFVQDETLKKMQKKLTELPEEKKIVCNCKRTKCLKLYCDCFNANYICGKDCNCEGCSNNDDQNQERIIAQQQISERNKQAFGKKIQVIIEGTVENKQYHYKGCNCKKSGCLKKYCECYQNNVNCSGLCKCEGCKNCYSPINKRRQQRFKFPIEDNYYFIETKKIKQY